MHPDHLLCLTVIRQFHMGDEGKLFMDTPQHLPLEDIIVTAQDRDEWIAMTAMQISSANNPDYQHIVPAKDIKPECDRWIGTGVDAVWVGPPPPSKTTAAPPPSTTTSQYRECVNQYWWEEESTTTT